MGRDGSRWMPWKVSLRVAVTGVAGPLRGKEAGRFRTLMPCRGTFFALPTGAGAIEAHSPMPVILEIKKRQILMNRFIDRERNRS